MSVREYAVLYLGKSGKPGAAAGGGNVVLSGGGQHALDGPEHLPTTDQTRLDASTTAHGLLPKLSGDQGEALRGDGTWLSAVTEEQVIALLTPDIYACASLTATTGTIAAGTHTDLHAVGGTTVQVNEVTGSPGFDIRAAFTGVDGITNVHCHGYYTGNHTATVQLYNYVSAAWDTVATFTASASAMELLSASIADGSPYFDGGGNAVVRFYHAANGNVTHRLYLDYLAVSHSTATTGGLALDDLTDVTAPTPAAADRIRYDGSGWANSALIWRPVMTYDGTNWLVAVDGSGNAIMTEA